MGATARQLSEGSETRRPLTPDEYAPLLALGSRLREFRQSCGLSLRRAAYLAGVGRNTIDRIEHGTRRTRAATLREIVAGMASVATIDVDAAVAELVALGGAAVVGESPNPERLAAARERRRARKARRAEVARDRFLFRCDRDSHALVRQGTAERWLQIRILDRILTDAVRRQRRDYRATGVWRSPDEYMEVPAALRPWLSIQTGYLQAFQRTHRGIDGEVTTFRSMIGRTLTPGDVVLDELGILSAHREANIGPLRMAFEALEVGARYDMA